MDLKEVDEKIDKFLKTLLFGIDVHKGSLIVGIITIASAVSECINFYFYTRWLYFLIGVIALVAGLLLVRAAQQNNPWLYVPWLIVGILYIVQILHVFVTGLHTWFFYHKDYNFCYVGICSHSHAVIFLFLLGAFFLVLAYIYSYIIVFSSFRAKLLELQKEPTVDYQNMHEVAVEIE